MRQASFIIPSGTELVVCGWVVPCSPSIVEQGPLLITAVDGLSVLLVMFNPAWANGNNPTLKHNPRIHFLIMLYLLIALLFRFNTGKQNTIKTFCILLDCGYFSLINK